ncbi:MAG: GAF and ANTAR domain-containing protein [Actinomycetales bacterium]|nr:GAF and ANTAR domain-containing protein [Actinomycetales bacterium]
MQGQDLAGLVERLSAEPELDYTLEQVVEEVSANVPGCDFCAVSLVRRGDIEHAAATDPLAQQLDALQVELGEGPSLEVSWDHEILWVHDLATESRWPRWVRAARDQGVGSSLTLLLPVDGPQAMLTMYSHRSGAFDQASIDLAAVYARLSGVAVQQAYHQDGLRTAMQSRLAIGVAQGILMQRYGISLDRAFEVLRRRSNETNTKLRDVALAIVHQTDPRALEGPALQDSSASKAEKTVSPKRTNLTTSSESGSDETQSRTADTATLATSSASQP